MEQIRNLSAYNDGMAKSLDDKLFFVPIIGEEIRQFEDFGCADGTLLEAMDRLFNNPFTAEFPLSKIDLVGYDMSSKMLELAEDRVPNARLIKNTLPLGTELKKNSCLNLSSVLHEVNSYCTEEEKEDFWDVVSCVDYDYITIRDMIYNGGENEQPDPMDVGRIYDAVRKYGKDFASFKEFEEIWGNLYLKKNLMHYLLKYRYKQNWKREVKENYLGYSTDDIIKLVGDEYEVIYRKDYILPFLYNKVEEDFGIKISTPTHTNLIFKRK
jgi:hypothetical protein